MAERRDIQNGNTPLPPSIQRQSTRASKRSQQSGGGVLNVDHPSPLLRKATTRGFPTLESITSDLSMDISDITMEIEKITKDKENPEEAIKDSTRLIKEIDHQMEVSFEIMEERNNMVREYLKEREESDRKHKTKADSLMANFNRKIRELQNSLSFVNEEEEATSIPGFTSTAVQTQALILQEIGVQANLGNIPNIDIEELVQALTEDIEETTRQRYLRERRMMVHELADKQTSLDTQEANLALETLKNELKEQENEQLRTIAYELAVEYTDNKENKTIMDTESIVNYLQGTPHVANMAVGEIEERELESYKNRYEKKVSNVLKKREKEQEDKMKTAIEGICTHSQNILHSRNELEGAIQNLLNLLPMIEDSRTLEDELVRLQLMEGEARKNIEEFIQKQNIDKKDAVDCRKNVVIGLECLNRIRNAEDEIRKLVVPEDSLVDSKEMFWRLKLAEAYRKNKELVMEKKRLILEMNIDGDSAALSSPRFYLKPVNIDDAGGFTIKPKLGSELIEKLSKDVPQRPVDEEIKAVELVVYQDTNITEILKKYEKEIDELGDRLSKTSAYEDVMRLVEENDSIDERDYETLSEEKKRVIDELVHSGKNLTNIEAKVQGLKQKKTRFLDAENKLKKQQTYLDKKIKDINKHVANKMVAKERVKEKQSHEAWIGELNKQIQRLEDKISDQKYLVDVDDNEDMAGDVRERITQLRKNLQKLSPFVNKHRLQKLPITSSNSENHNQRVPDEQEIDDVLKRKEELSRRLLEVENKIQEIITSEGYESSIGGSGTMENIEEVQHDRHSPAVGVSNGTSLNRQLQKTKKQFDEINQQLVHKGVLPTDYEVIETSCRALSKEVRKVEKQLRLPEVVIGVSKDISNINVEIKKLRNGLAEQEVSDMEYSKVKENELVEQKSTAIQKLKDLTSCGDRELKDSSVSIALKDLLQERDRTQNYILSLNDDLEALGEAGQSSSGRTDLAAKLTEINEQLLDKKATNVTKTLTFAKNRLGFFIHLVKMKMHAKLEEASNANWENKERVSREEKQNLGKHLKEVVDEMQKVEIDLDEMNDYKANGVGKSDIVANQTLKILVEKKIELMKACNALDDQMEEEKQRHEGAMNLQLLVERNKVGSEIVQVNERIEDEHVLLQNRQQQLQDTKRQLEGRLADCIEVEDLQQIVSELDMKEPSMATQHLNDASESELVNLMKERRSVHENIEKVIHHSPNERGKIKKMNEVLQGIDGEILAQVDDILVKVDTATTPHVKSEDKMEVYDLLATTANAFNFIRDQEEISEALGLATDEGQEDSKEIIADVDELGSDREEIARLEGTREKLEDLEQRNLDTQDMTTMKQLKELNEKKLDKLLDKIKNLNKLVGIQRKLDRKLKEGSRDLSLNDLQEISAATERISSELKSIVRTYDDNVDTDPQEIPGTSKDNKSVQMLNSMLQHRDQMLNNLFNVTKEIGDPNTSSVRKRKLVEEKNILTQQLEVIDESIVSCSYLENVVRVESPHRSFSPRSTSSRASFTMHLEERDSVLKDLFQVKKNKEKIMDLEKDVDQLHHIEEEERVVNDRLKEMTIRLLGRGFEGDSMMMIMDRDGEVSSKIPQVQGGRHLEKAVEALDAESKDERTIHLHLKNGTDSPVAYKEPPELYCLEEIRLLEKKLNIESMKKALRSLEEEKKIIEESIQPVSGKGVRIIKKKKDLEQLRAKLDATKSELVEKQNDLELLVKRKSLETKLGEINEKQKAVDAEDSIKECCLKEHKQNKVDLEKRLDDIDSVIHQYFQATKAVVEKEVVKDPGDVSQDTLTALKQHHRDVKNCRIEMDTCPEVTLSELINKRKETVEKLTKVNDTLKRFDESERNQQVTRELQKYCKQEKQAQDENKKLKHKNELLDKMLGQYNNSVNKTSAAGESVDNVREKLGKGLHQVIFESDENELIEDTSLIEMKRYLQDSTVEDYINNLQNLSKLQAEQIEHLKQDLTSVNEKGVLSEELYDENLNKLQEELVTASINEDIFKQKLGGKLFEILKSDAHPKSPSKAKHGSFETKLNRYLENVKTVLHRNEANLEEMLEYNFEEIEKQAKQIEEQKEEESQLQRRIKKLESTLKEHEEQIEFIKKLEEMGSETESMLELRAPLKAVHTSEENTRLKDEYETRVKELNKENEVLKKMIEETSECQSYREESLMHEIESLKSDLTVTTGKMNTLTESEQDLKTEMENMRKKLRKATRDKSNVEESLDQEIKSVGQLQEDVVALQQKEKQSVSDMHKNCQHIEKLERDIKTHKDTIQNLEINKTQTNKNFEELKEKYQNLSTKHQNEILKNNKEMKVVKSKAQQDIDELSNSNHELIAMKEQVAYLQNELRTEQESRSKENAVYQQNVDDHTKERRMFEEGLKEIEKNVKKLEEKNTELQNENRALVCKIDEVSESYESEMSEAIVDVKDNHAKTIDGLNKKVQSLSDEVMLVERSKNILNGQCEDLKIELERQTDQVHELEIIIDGNEKTQGLKMMSVKNELEGMKLENDELHDQVLSLKQDLKRHQSMEILTKELINQKQYLNEQVKRFQDEKSLFEESVQEFLEKKHDSFNKEKQQKESQISLKLLRAAQHERDNVSDELIRVNRELHLTKNDNRKLKMNLKEREQNEHEEQTVLMKSLEEDQKRKLDDQDASHKKETEQIMMAYHEERSKWEEEMTSLKRTLQEESIRKLAEQRNDYEVELEKQIKLYLQHNEEDLIEERDKNAELEKQRARMLEQFEEDKMGVTKKYECQKKAMVEIIKRLLKHLMLLKKQRTRLRNSYEDEISELEERLHVDKETPDRTQEPPTKDIPTKTITFNNNETKRKTNNKTIDKLERSASFPLTTALTNDDTSMRMSAAEKECTNPVCQQSFTLTDLRELLQMGDLKDLLSDSDYEDEKEFIQKSMREQYESKLRVETDYLMKRLLELSEELDSLRLNN